MSPRSEEQNELLKDERREQILSAALRCFATRGYAATKVSDIVTRAGMSHGLVYHYFKSKEEVFYALLKRAIETSTQSILSVEPLPLPSLEKIRQIARYILGGIESFEDSAYYFLIVVHASIMESPSTEHEDIMSTSGVTLQSFSRIIKKGQEEGEIKDGDPLGMTLVFFSAIQGLAMYKLAMTDFKMPDPEILVNMIKK